MNLMLDNRTQTVVQVAVSTMLCVIMLIVWRTQKTYPGFGRWTLGKVPNMLGWLLIGLRGLLPNWLSVLLANVLLLLSVILVYEGIRQFRGKPPHDAFNYGVLILLINAFIYFTWVQPNVNARVVTICGCAALICTRCALNLFLGAPRNLRSSYWFTATMFALYDLVLLLRVVTSRSLPSLSNPFDADMWQSILFLATNVVGIGWTFGFFMMTNQRLTLELQITEMELRKIATTDFLTGALNRRAFLEVSQSEQARACEKGHELALLIIDIDHFKKVNDTYGHLGGDALLREVVATCHANLRGVDVLARWGGEEFAVLLTDTDEGGCLRVAEKLRCAVADLSVPINTKYVQATISVGCALWKPEDEMINAVLQNADSALYQAKQGGRNRVVMYRCD